MKLYLAQHAEAKSKEEDSKRPLSAKGRQNAEAVASLASKLDFDVIRIFNSGKTRTIETADIFGDVLKPTKGVAAISGLGPLDDVKPVAEILIKEGEDVILVGHLPFMAKMAGYLLTGDPETNVVKFQNAGIVCLVRDDDHWQVEWIMTSEVARACN